MNRPLIAAHRGLSSIYPENTLEGIKAALQAGSDYIEIDVVLSQDLKIMVCHDAFLSKVSNVESVFPQRKCKRILDGEEKDDWWIMDFKLEELKQLRLRQCILDRSKEHDWQYQMPTLEEVLYEVSKFQSKGILLEVKDFKFHLQYQNEHIASHVINHLNLENKNQIPIILMSFEPDAVKFFKNETTLERVQLIWHKHPLDLEEVVQYTQYVGIDLLLLYKEGKTTEYYEQAKKLGLKLFGWTFQDDNNELHQLFGTDDLKQIYTCMELQGIITEFPLTALKFF